jgi:hypothetical protein
MRAFVFAALLFVGLPAQAAEKDRIVGTWKLVSVVYEDAQTKERTPVLGEHPRGRSRRRKNAGLRWLPPTAGRCRKPTRTAPRRCAA